MYVGRVASPPPGYTAFFVELRFESAGSSPHTFTTEVTVIEPVPEGGLQKPGDCNHDGTLDVSDGICLLGNLFLGEPAELPCGDGTSGHPGNVTLLDSNGDGTVNVSDAVSLFGFLFLGTPGPVLGAECVPIAGCPGTEVCR